MAKEGAEAVKAVAETAREYRPEVRAAGEFFASVIGRPAQQAGGLLADGIGALRLEFSLRYYARVKRLMHEQGLDGPTRTAAISVALPLLEAASMEEDDTLQSMFAQLLVNATNAAAPATVSKSFVEAVRIMSPLDARLLNAIFDAPEDVKREGGFIYTQLLPDAYLDAPSSKDPVNQFPVSEDVLLALASLESSGCIRGAATWGGFTILDQAIITPYGAALIKATRAPKS